ncbi:MAG: TonB-dependent receptor [Formosimonas sp.]
MKKAVLTSVALAASMGSHSVWAQDVGATDAPTIVVEGVKTREQIGLKPVSTNVGKIKQKVKDIPQAVTSVTEQLMHDKNADTLKEALRNVAGITFNAGEGGRIGDNINLRGYSAVGDLYMDNIRDYAQYTRETFNFEQIDVLKGASSMLFGRGSTGGVINQVSKVAKPVDRNEISVTGGSNRYTRATVDLNKAVTDNVSLRLNAMKTDAKSFRNDVESSRWGIAPTLTIGAGTQDEWSLAYYYLKSNATPDYGVPYVKSAADGIARPLDVPISRFYGLSQVDFEKNRTGIATATYTHLFNNDSSIKTTLRDSRYDRDLRAVAPRLLGAGLTDLTVNANTVVNRQRQARGGKEHQTVLQSDFNTKFATGSVKHELLAGVELTRERSNRWTNSNSIANPTTTVGSDNSTPTLPNGFAAGWTRTAPNSYKANSYGLYVQDTVEFIPKWKVLAGLRYDRLNADYTRSTGGDLSLNVGALSGRAGLLYQPNVDATYYVSYSTGFNSTAEAYQLDDRLANTDPEKTRNIEVGAKWSLLNDQLSVRTSLSRSEKTNERNTDLANPNVYLLSGQRHTDAWELEAAGRLSDKWEVFVNYALMKSKIDQAAGTAANTQGRVPRNTPRHTAALWTTYKLPYGFKVGAGLEYVGKRWANDTNTTLVGGYARVDGLVEYNVNKWLNVKLNVKNAFNKKYYEGVYGGHVLPGTPRTFELNLTAKF